MLIRVLNVEYFCIVREAPLIEILPSEPQVLKVGEFALFRCRAIAGVPAPTLAWTRRDGSLLSNHIEEKSPGTILIANATIGEAGEYQCIASNIVGETSKITSITVQQPHLEVSILPNKTEITLTEGEKLELLCMANGDKPSIVQWYGPSIHGYQASLRNSTFDNYAIYRKYRVSQHHEGIYQCRANNDDGHNQKQVKVLIQPNAYGRKSRGRRMYRSISML